MRAFGIDQQSEPPASQLRPCAPCSHQRRGRTQALLRSRDHRGAPAAAPTARRAGWIGCNILLNEIPESGKIFFVRNGQPQPKKAILDRWRQTLFLREAGAEARGWLIEVMKCVEAIGRRDYTLGEVYAFESRLGALYPNNRHVRQKIPQQLQVLRDHGYLEFVSRGYYRLRSQP